MQEQKGFRMGEGPFEGDAVAMSGRARSVPVTMSCEAACTLRAAEDGLRTLAKRVLLAESEVVGGDGQRATCTSNRYA